MDCFHLPGVEMNFAFGHCTMGRRFGAFPERAKAREYFFEMKKGRSEDLPFGIQGGWK
jgi:hypothetical protein